MTIVKRPVDAWNHTAHYHGVLLEGLPRHCRRALDVGCGAGAFARVLAARADEVVGIDRSADMIECARGLSTGLANLRFVEADFLTHPLEPESFDFISLLAVVHHAPFETTVERAKAMLRPGGVLGVIGLWRDRAVVDFVPNVVGFLVSRWHRHARGASERVQPMAHPTMTLDEIRSQVSTLLPGAVVRRHVLWRYSVLWTRPSD
jgi:SAM-dependent methyltransferase